jgi:uncharacterized protein (DUF1800 family)
MVDQRTRLAWLMASTLALSACGGGGGGSSTPSPSPAPAPSPTPSPAPSPTPAPAPAPAADKPATRAEAARFLTQATFGPTDADIDKVMTLGYSAWIDAQFALPASSHRAVWEAADAAIKATKPTSAAGQNEVHDAFWTHAVSAPDQLRQRVAYALSQIFVISLADNNVAGEPRGAAAWMDLLANEGLGNYRNLLEAVSRNPLMGYYLSHARNQRANAATGRVPDENYAREVMQLFSIGLVKLDEAGNGTGEATYGPADVSGLARVFTGWSWYCPEWPNNDCFTRGSANGASDPDKAIKPMLGYPQYHSAEDKPFLSTWLPAQEWPDPQASMKGAMDALASHTNVGPFIGRQLIQRLVTSNPTPAHVTAVSRAFANNGQGVRGDMKAVIKAVLLHPDARVQSDQAGKLREPVLRLSAFLRAYGFKSETGGFRVGNTDNLVTSLGQTPLRSPSVFNFYRPGYVPPGTKAAGAGLAVPEMQIVHETTTAGYVNTMRDNVANGVGSNAPSGKRDLQGNFSAEIALADKPVDLVNRVTGKLIPSAVPGAFTTAVAQAVSSVTIPALNATGSNQSTIDTAKRTRVNIALLLTLVSPEFQVQK